MVYKREWTDCDLGFLRNEVFGPHVALIPFDNIEDAIRIYNDMVEKSRDTYHASVKLAKSQVMEVSAVFVCLFIILLTIIGVS